MSNLKEISIIDREKLDEKDYLISLLNEAKEKNIITDDNINNIQIQILELLYKSIERYNGVENNSIRKEIMENIAISNMYTLNIYLKSLINPDKALNELLTNGILDIYEKGKNKINTKIKTSRTVYKLVLNNMLNIDNDIYNDTIKKGIKGFFKIYDPYFNSQDMKITADYPLYNNIIGKLEGIEFIEKYLNYIYLENEFLNMFEINNIKYLLYQYSHDYKKLCINIFEIVFLELFGCKFANSNLYDLTIYNYELEKIYELFNKLTNKQIENLLNKTYEEIENELLKENNELKKYTKNNLSDIKFIIKSSLKNKTLDKIFLTKKIVQI